MGHFVLLENHIQVNTSKGIFLRQETANRVCKPLKRHGHKQDKIKWKRLLSFLVTVSIQDPQSSSERKNIHVMIARNTEVLSRYELQPTEI